jgi:hypothetical protein
MRRSLAVQLSVLGLVAGIAPFYSTADSAKVPPVDSLAIVDAKDFLERYRTLNSTQSPEFFDLYSDRAIVHAQVIGQTQGVSFQGRAYKQWARALLQRGRAGLDGSMFREATVEQRGTRLVLRAKRYSLAHCYWDVTFQVGIEKEEAVYLIIEERFAVNLSARCDAADSRVVSLGGGDDGAALGGNSPSLVRTDISPPSGGYHPLTQQEIADTAWRLGQQITASKPAAIGPLPADSLVSAVPGNTYSVGVVPRTMRTPAVRTSALWRTPEN